MHNKWLRISLYILGGVCIAFILAASGFAYLKNAETVKIQNATYNDQSRFTQVLHEYQDLLKRITEAGSVDTTEVKADAQTARTQLVAKEYDQAQQTIATAIAKLEALLAKSAEDAKLAAEALAQKQGTLAGTITGPDSKGLAGAVATLLSGADTVTKATADAAGKYSLAATAGSYTLSVSKSGYSTVQKTAVIKAQATTTLDVSMTTAPTPTPKATTPPTQSAVDGSTYERKTVSTSRGTYTVDVLTADMNKVRMVTDVAAESDCFDNCPTKSLQSYVSSNGGFAGMNGTYFCPTDYAECAGKTNTFYWKVYISRLNKIINANNGQGESDPAIVLTTSGQPRYFSHWSDFVNSGISISAGINSRPALLNGGSIVLDEGQLDTKQRTTKGNRGAIGIKGSTIYCIIAKSATVIDLAAVADALELDSAMNLDGGGSSAMYYNGGYKVGPGRSLPNAIIFATK